MKTASLQTAPVPGSGRLWALPMVASPHDTRRDPLSLLCRSVDQIGPKVKPFFAPSVFLTFEADQYGRIGIYPFYLYMMRMTSLTQVAPPPGLEETVVPTCPPPSCCLALHLHTPVRGPLTERCPQF